MVGFTLDPHEFFLGYDEKGAYTGFSVIHLMKKGNSFVFYIEKPYTNENMLVGEMRASADGFAGLLRQESAGKGIGVAVQTAWDNATKSGLVPLKSIHAKKYYDVLGKTAE